MKLMLLVIIILAILCTLLAFGVSKLYDYMKHKEDKNNIHKRSKNIIKENELKVEKIKSQINMNEDLIEIYKHSIPNRARLIELEDEINNLNKLIEEIEGEKINE